MCQPIFYNTLQQEAFQYLTLVGDGVEEEEQEEFTQLYRCLDESSSSESDGECTVVTKKGSKKTKKEKKSKPRPKEKKTKNKKAFQTALFLVSVVEPVDCGFGSLNLFDQQDKKTDGGDPNKEKQVDEKKQLLKDAKKALR